ncbi:MAG: pantetheine-phosphate adenylyltransferase [Clostridiales bacterium]|jgi:pantetheine-phosphate adenylyltransferase|nr:pantetheine-phosphate adenylyltransferase [Clostridiales bacterium]
MLLTAVYPGSFDPVTYGHLDIIRRASVFTDRLIVAVLTNSAKSSFFSVEERLDMLSAATDGMEGVVVRSFSGLTVDFCRSVGSNLIVRGLRAVTDFESEFQMALTNRELAGEVDTIFISTSTKYLFLSSSIVREIALYGGDVSAMVTPGVAERLTRRFKG